VVLYAHDYTDLPVAKALGIDIVPGVGLRAQIQFAPPGANPKADSVRALWAAGFLNAASVGFVPRTADPNGSGKRFTDWELLEFSIVSVPANADALRLAAKSLRPEQKRGRVLSGVNEKRIRDAVSALTEVLNQLDSQTPETPADEQDSGAVEQVKAEAEQVEQVEQVEAEVETEVETGGDQFDEEDQEGEDSATVEQKETEEQLAEQLTELVQIMKEYLNGR
jgi:HK97 family phage prohead protease